MTTEFIPWYQPVGEPAMLEHEAPDTKTATPPPATPLSVTPPSVASAAERRVSPEELTAALTALDANKQLAAKQLAETVPIGQVVSEMGLEATPEEIWAQVQAQRAQKSVKEQAAEEANQIPFEQAAKQAYRQRSPAVSPLPILPMRPRLTMPLLRRLSKVKGWVWIVFWCTGGFGLFSAFSHHSAPPMTTSGQTISITGDLETETINAQGKDVVITGDSDNITLHGKARSVTVNGDLNTLQGDAPQTSDLHGDGNNVQWADSVTPKSP